MSTGSGRVIDHETVTMGTNETTAHLKTHAEAFPGRSFLKVSRSAGRPAHLGAAFAVAAIWLAAGPVLTPHPADAATITVRPDGSGDYPTIQAAINAAVAGDVVLLAPGTYTGPGNRSIDFRGKAVTVRGQAGAENTIIDCQGVGRGVQFKGNAEANAVLEDVTITNGNVPGGQGGGVRCESASPTIRRCILRDNIARHGGGIYALKSNIAIIDCTIERNTADGGQGGGLFIDGTKPTLSHCHIRNNRADLGGGLLLTSRDGTVDNCVIAWNLATIGAGGVYDFSSKLTMTYCTVVANVAPDRAGGLYLIADRSLVTNCISWGNVPSAPYPGPQANTAAITYSDIEGGWPGEGNIDQDPRFVSANDLRLAENSPCIDAGTDDPPGTFPATDLNGVSRPIDANGDQFAAPDMGAFERVPTTPVILLSESVVPFVYPSDGSNPPGQVFKIRNGGVGTLSWRISESCEWLEVVPASGESSGEADEVTLSVDVTGLEAEPRVCTVAVSDPLARNSPQLVQVYLRPPGPLYVPSSYPTIQAAIDVAVDHDEIVVANGTYTGPGNTNLNPRGKAVTVRSENGPSVTIIDCEGVSPALRFVSGETSDCVVEGFTILVGAALQPIARDNASGVLCVGSHPTIRNCRILGDSPHDARGSGIYCVESSPTIAGCTITGIRAYRGGAVNCTGGSPTFVGCEISDNSAEETGGILCAAGKGATLADCTVRDNRAVLGAGGLYLSGDSTVTNCRILDNSGAEGGGIYGVFRTVQDCDISGNTARLGGGIRILSGEPDIVNCNIARNRAEIQGGGVFVRSGVLYPRLTGCTIVGNWAWIEGGGFWCSGSNPLLTNCILAGNSTENLGGGLLVNVRTFPGPSLIHCVLASNHARVAGGIYTFSGSGTSLANTILWSNVDTGGMDESAQVDGAAPAVNYSCIHGWTGAFGGVGNIGANPRFIRLPDDGGDGWGDDPDTPDADESANDDYGDLRLRGRSPCIDAGDSAAVPAGIVTDLAGGPRFIDDPATPDTGQAPAGLAVVDLGPYEFDPAADDDGDSFANGQDNCSGDPNPDQADADGDTAGDVCDNCRWMPNPDQHDADDDGIGDVCDACPATIPGIAVDDEGCPPAIPGDLDRDGDIDAADAGIFLGCLTGPNAGPPDPACTPADLDADHDVDQSDFGRLQPCLTAPDVPADPACADGGTAGGGE